MRMTGFGRRVFLGLAGYLLLACMSPTEAAETSITIAAASSLTEVVDALGKSFEKKTGVKVATSYSASSVAAQQVINGAPFDVLISANPAWIQVAHDHGALVPGSVRSVTGNGLVVIAAPGTPIDAGMSVVDVLRIAGDKNWPIAIADPDHVPAGIYARQTLTALGLHDLLKGQLVPLQNVRAVIAFVDRGETPVGFAYATDVRICRGCRKVASVAPSLHRPIEYRAAVPIHAVSPGLGKAFIEFMSSNEGQAVFRQFGFLPSPQPNPMETDSSNSASDGDGVGG